jgi:hypothetical protein
MCTPNKSRSRFLLGVFIVGACAPAVWVGIRFALRDLPISLGNSEILGWVIYAIYFVTFPTQILFLDAEDLTTILFLLLIVTPVNGAWMSSLLLSFCFSAMRYTALGSD